MKIKIDNVLKDSIAFEVGIEKGDFLLSIDKKEIKDILDYKFLTASDYFTLEIEKRELGEIWDIEIEKEPYEELGLIFESITIDEPRQCKNNCIFCFMAQMPKGLRETLYFKDDDYRLSFIEGNYVTLTNMREEDLDRVINLGIHHINISIHTTNGDLRKDMLKNPNASKILSQLKKLKDNNITFNGQIVLCKGFNDGEELEKTLEDLLLFESSLTSLSVVPVGLSKYRENLTFINPFTKDDAVKTIDIIDKFREKFFKKSGKHTLYPSDEFFILGEKRLPDLDYYEEFLQYENGVGMMSSFYYEAGEYLKSIKPSKKKRGSYTIATGILAYPFIKDLSCSIMEKANVDIKVIPVKNEFFGDKITVAGLLCGEDIINALKDIKGCENLLLSESMFKDGNNLFLDDKKIEDVENILKVNIIKSPNTGEDFVKIFI